MTEPIDLGLSDILENTKINEQEPAKESPVQIKTDNSKNESWQEVSASAEIALKNPAAKNKELLKACWLQAELHIKRVPIGVLSSQLEDLVRNNLNFWQDENRKNQISKVLSQFFNELSNSGSYHEALPLIELIQKINLNDLDTEKAIKCIEIRKKEIQEILPHLRTGVQSSELIWLDELLEKLFIKSVEEKNTDTNNWLAAPIIQPALSTAQPQPKNSNYSLVYLIFLLPLLYYLYLQRFHQDYDFEIAQPEGNSLDDSFIKNDFAFPTLQKILPEGKLASLQYQAQAQLENTAVPPGIKLSDIEPRIPESTVLPINTLAPKPTLNLTGPVEPSEVRDRLLKAKRQPGNNERTIDSDAPARVITDDQDLNNSGYYEVLINTTVFDKPSFRAKSVGDLMQGDKIVVLNRKGKWLKIESRGGEPGYILASEAERAGLDRDIGKDTDPWNDGDSKFSYNVRKK